MTPNPQPPELLLPNPVAKPKHPPPAPPPVFSPLSPKDTI